MGDRRGRSIRFMVTGVAGAGLVLVALGLAGLPAAHQPGGVPPVGEVMDGVPGMDCGPLFESPVGGAYYFVCQPRPAAAGGDEAERGPASPRTGRLWLARRGGAGVASG